MLKLLCGQVHVILKERFVEIKTHAVLIRVHMRVHACVHVCCDMCVEVKGQPLELASSIVRCGT